MEISNSQYRALLNAAAKPPQFTLAIPLINESPGTVYDKACHSEHDSLEYQHVIMDTDSSFLDSLDDLSAVSNRPPPIMIEPLRQQLDTICEGNSSISTATLPQ